MFLQSCVLSKVPAIVVLSNEVVPARVKLSEIVTVSAKEALSLTNNVPPTEVLLSTANVPAIVVLLSTEGDQQLLCYLK